MQKWRLLTGLWLRCDGRRRLSCFLAGRLGTLCRALFGLLFGLGFGVHVEERQS